MWGARWSRDDGVNCIACGASVARENAREYDKHGDRWDRAGKEFEYLCVDCNRDLCHQPRDGLESRLVESRAGERDREAFLAAYDDLVTADEDSPERRDP